MKSSIARSFLMCSVPPSRLGLCVDSLNRLNIGTGILWVIFYPVPNFAMKWKPKLDFEFDFSFFKSGYVFKSHDHPFLQRPDSDSSSRVTITFSRLFPSSNCRLEQTISRAGSGRPMCSRGVFFYFTSSHFLGQGRLDVHRSLKASVGL